MRALLPRRRTGGPGEAALGPLRPACVRWGCEGEGRLCLGGVKKCVQLQGGQQLPMVRAAPAAPSHGCASVDGAPAPSSVPEEATATRVERAPVRRKRAPTRSIDNRRAAPPPEQSGWQQCREVTSSARPRASLRCTLCKATWHSAWWEELLMREQELAELHAA